MTPPWPQVARDLMWVVNSPSLCTGPHTAPSLPLDVERIDVEHLTMFMANRQEHRVGRYFEHLLLYWLKHVRELEIVGSGIQVRDGKRTIGEVDYLYRDEAAELTHCEASVKFFLHHPRLDTSHYPGPNASDNFERKMAKLFDQQLPLSKAEFPDVTQRHGFVKGIIFYRQDVSEPTERPTRLASDHLRGSWLRESEIDQLPSDQSGLIADKPHWLSPRAIKDALSATELRSALRAHFAGRAHPVMLTLFADGEASQRLFVVPDIWPARPT